MKAAVIGAANIDIIASPLGKYIPKDSNPGTVEISFGGVGRNIAHNLALLGVEVGLCTVFGGDILARTLMKACGRIGMDLRCSVIVPDLRSNFFLCINDEKGEMRSAVSDMEAMDALDEKVLSRNLGYFNGCDFAAADCNMPSSSLCFLARNLAVPLYIDGTSSLKVRRILPLLEQGGSYPLMTLKVNAREAHALCGLQDPQSCARWFLSRGIGRILITLGEDGVYAHDGKEEASLRPERVKVVNTTGAGDALLSAAAYALTLGRPLGEALRTGLEAAGLTLQCEGAVNEEISTLHIKQDHHDE